MPHYSPGVSITHEGLDFAVFSRNATALDLCLFDDTGAETRIAMSKGVDQLWRARVPGAGPGTRYGYRADGTYAPEKGLWFDPSKLLVDPYAVTLDRPFVFSPDLSAFGVDTAPLVPRAVVTALEPLAPELPVFSPGGLIYEVNVRALTMRHPDIPENLRGTVAALAHPVIIAHLRRIGVSTVELMPITAWIDERHLPPLGLRNSWGYNPIAMMALDPRLCPGGIGELAAAVAALHAEGIGTILDLVFNHTGESDQLGPTLSMRGLDSLAYYRHPDGHPGLLINDTGCGNTLACDHPIVHDLVLDTLRHFIRHAGVDGFRFDLAPIMGRDLRGFSPDAALFRAMLADPDIGGRVLIAEPWDVGWGGYQLGNFPEPFLEWNDWARDTFRTFWRGDDRKIGDLASALAGSSNCFGRNGASATRTVNFVAAHDGFSLRDLVSYTHKHNELNGEHNRDGHSENHSWNNGVEGETSDPEILAARQRDVRALLSTLFVSRGSIMIMAGDEMGRSQHGNNNAYAQDNELTWLDWDAADQDLIDHVAALSEIRNRFACFSSMAFFTGQGDVEWLNARGEPMTVADWEDPDAGVLAMVLSTIDRANQDNTRLAILFNRDTQPRNANLPGGIAAWTPLRDGPLSLAPRSVGFFVETLF